MCVSAAVWRAGQPVEWADTIEELAAILGEPPVMDVKGYGEELVRQILAEPRQCLCAVDFKATAAQHGLRLSPPGYGMRCWHVDAWGLKDPTIKERMPPRVKTRLKDHLKGAVAELPSPTSTPAARP